MVQEKCLDGNRLIAQKMGLPNLLQQSIIVSNSQVELVENEVMAKYTVGIRNTTGDHLTHHLTSLVKKVLQRNFDHANFNSIEDAIVKSIFMWYG